MIISLVCSRNALCAVKRVGAAIAEPTISRARMHPSIIYISINPRVRGSLEWSERRNEWAHTHTAQCTKRNELVCWSVFSFSLMQPAMSERVHVLACERTCICACATWRPWRCAWPDFAWWQQVTTNNRCECRPKAQPIQKRVPPEFAILPSLAAYSAFSACLRGWVSLDFFNRQLRRCQVTCKVE